MTSRSFRNLAADALGVDLDPKSPHGRLLGAGGRSLFIPAAAGAGKTTALALLALEAIFVDDFTAESIVATTFTRKAAVELRSRITRGVMAMAELTGRRIDEPQLDIAAMRIGTLDDLAHQALIELQLGALIDGTVQKGLMRQAVFDGTGYFKRGGVPRALVQGYLEPLFGNQETVSAIRDCTVTLHDRLGQDRVNIKKWTAADRGAEQTHLIIEHYRESLGDRGQMDFVVLEQEFLAQLQSGGLAGWLSPVRVLLVDEYQDTNLLQETIYRHIAEHVLGDDGWFAIVGDDEQSLYRFRGATVELFVDAPKRFPTGLITVNLNVNRRSAKPILDFANRFVRLDARYQAARAAGKQPLVPAPRRDPWRASDRLPVLGLFREDLPTLAGDMTRAMTALRGRGWRTPAGTIAVTQPGDIAILAPTTGAITESWGRKRRRLFAELADCCATARIGWFNPRGTRLADVPCVQQLLGVALECLDPNEQFLPGFMLNQARSHMDAWRNEAKALIKADPEPRRPHRLRAFVAAWHARRPQGRAKSWPREFPLMELLHELTVWIPELRTSPGFLYLEGLTRSLDQLGTLFGPWAVLISRDRWDRSVKKLYEEFFIPIALDEVDLDEEVLEVLPLDAVNAITFHQAKGLEFPVCFVDVGSRFKSDHPAHAFARFPDAASPSSPYTLEDAVRPFSALRAPRRSAVDRAFDDLIRMFYVGFTRAQHLLVLVGLGDADAGPKAVPNVATGLTRDGNDHWPELGVALV